MITKTNLNKLHKLNKFEEICNLLKNRQLFYDHKKNEIFVYLTDGSACDSPIITKNIKKSKSKYSFDSYGSVFKNWMEWDRCGGYGGCGTFGYTNSLRCVFNSCVSFNKEGKIALITKPVMEDLIKDGYLVKTVSFGFR